MKCPASYIKDRKKARKLVTEVLESPGDYVCLRCGKPQKSYRCLVAHKAGCCNDKGPRLAGEMLAKPQVKVEDDAQDTELSNYITGKNVNFTINHYALASLYPVPSLNPVGRSFSK